MVDESQYSAPILRFGNVLYLQAMKQGSTEIHIPPTGEISFTPDNEKDRCFIPMSLVRDLQSLVLGREGILEVHENRGRIHYAMKPRRENQTVHVQLTSLSDEQYSQYCHPHSA